MLALAFLTIATEHTTPPSEDQIPVTRNEVATLIIDGKRCLAPAALVHLAASPAAPRQNL